MALYGQTRISFTCLLITLLTLPGFRGIHFPAGISEMQDKSMPMHS